VHSQFIFTGVIFVGWLAVCALLILFLRDMRLAWRLAETLRRRQDRTRSGAKWKGESFDANR